MSYTKTIIRAMTAWKFSDDARPHDVEEALNLLTKLVEENMSLEFQVKALSEMQFAFADQLSEMRVKNQETKYVIKTLIPYARKSNMSGIDSAISAAEKLIGK